MGVDSSVAGYPRGEAGPLCNKTLGYPHMQRNTDIPEVLYAQDRSENILGILV